MDRSELIQLLYRSPEAIACALRLLYNAQTGDERASGATRHRNGQGFNATDAAFGSSLARQAAGGRRLTRHQIIAARQMLEKYAGQLLASGTDWGQFASRDANTRRGASELTAARSRRWP